MYISLIKDITNSDFLGLNIYIQDVSPYIEKMRNILKDECDEFCKNQKYRDNGHYHCTLFNVAEYNKIKKTQDIKNIFSEPIDDVKFLGIGVASDKGNTCYFIVVNSNKLQELRRRFGLSEKDFHITIGFKQKDVHGVRKNEIIKEKEPFLVTLKQYYFDFDCSFNFCKYINHFPVTHCDPVKDEVICTKIAKTYAEFKIGAGEIVNRFTICLSNNDNFIIGCKWVEYDEKTEELSINKIKEIL